MKKYYNELEQLSAYVDDELTLSEKSNIEEKIVLSQEAKNKVDEYQKLKLLTKQAVKPLPESHFFETRVLQALKENKPGRFSFKVYAPVLGFTLLALFFIAIFKFNPQLFSKFIDEQSKTIATLYKDNLKPLLYAANLSNEDIFNFAMYKQLPLDATDKQYLQLGFDKNGSEYFQITNAAQFENSNNLEKFLNALNLNDSQKMKIDSILSYYAEEIQSQVLVNEKNTVAISPKLWDYNKAIMADIFSYLAKTNKKQFMKIMPAGYSYYSGPEVVRVVQEIKDVPENDYIFFTPDSVFHEDYYFDREEFNREMKELQKELKRDLEEANREMKEAQIEFNVNIKNFQKDSLRNKKFKVYVDDNVCRVHIPRVEIPDIEIPDLESISKDIEEAMKNIEVFVSVMPPFVERPETPERPERPNRNFNYNFQFNDSTFKHQIYIPNVDSILRSINTDSIVNNALSNSKINLDSIMNMVKIFVGDSLQYFNSEEFEESMKEFQQEMKEFKQEMKELQLEKKKNLKKKKAPLEI